MTATGSRAGAIVFLLAFALYASTVAPTVYNLDSAELTTAAWTGGLVRATGYPLYLLLGWLWSHLLPWGDPGWRMNLLSAACGALGLALTDRILARLGVGALGRAGAVGLLGTSRFYWSMSLVAEVYALHVALLAALLAALLRWRERPTAGRLGLASLLAGLALANHVSTILLAPGLAALVLAAHRREALRPKPIALALAGLLAGLSLYLYLPLASLREPAFNYAGSYDAQGHFVALDLTQPRELLWLASGRSFAPLMMAYGPGELAGQLGSFGAELWRTFLGVGLVPGLLGAGVLVRRDRPLAIATLLMFGGFVGFYLGYAATDKDTMLLPAYWIWSLWLGLGLQWLGEAIRAGEPRSPARRGRALLAALVACAVLGALAWNGPLVALSGDTSARDHGLRVLERLPAGALLVGDWATVPVVEYLQLVEGRRPDVSAINRFLIAPRDLARLLRESSASRPVYVDAEPALPWLGVALEPDGPLFRVRPVARRTRPEPPGGGRG